MVTECPLHESDLPPADKDFLRVVDKKYFKNKYGEAKRIYIYGNGPIVDPITQKRIPKRLAAVLPLQVEKLGTIPIPFNYVGSWCTRRIVSRNNTSAYPKGTEYTKRGIHNQVSVCVK